MRRAALSLVAALIALVGCALHVDEEDVFLPWMAEGTSFTVTDDETGVIFERNRPAAGLFEAAELDIRDGVFDSALGPLAYRLARGPDPDAPLLVHCGGNSFDVPSHGDLAIWKLAPHGDALVWDYPGYGDSAGDATVADFRVAVAALAETIAGFRRTPDQRVVLWGHSLGGFVCSELAAAAPVIDAIIFEASAPSAPAASKYLAPAPLRPFVRVRLSDEIASFDNVAALSKRPIKALVLGARKDRILPVQLSRALRTSLEDAGHAVTYFEFRDSNHFHVGFQPDLPEVVSHFLAGETYRPDPAAPRARPPKAE
ncbi:MAG: alpha/beta hydrolase [Pseudomonadota bacterium]